MRFLDNNDDDKYTTEARGKKIGDRVYYRERVLLLHQKKMLKLKMIMLE